MACALLLCSLLALPLRASGPVADYQVKAVYLYHFLKFIEWPDVPNETAELTICVAGGDPFFGELNVLTQRQHAAPLIRVRYLAEHELPRSCQLLFISERNPQRLAVLLQRLSGSSVVTVGDARAFARRGGMIGFVTRDDRVALEINLQALRDAGVKVSADLLDIATQVTTEPDAP